MSNFKIFVIMPFDPELNDLYAYIKSVIESDTSFQVFRADDLVNQQNILKDIVQSIYTSDLILADLTGLNPNVFYELGLAHALNKNVILLTQDISELPFDLRSYRVLPYSTHFSKIKELENSIKRIIDEVKKGTCKFGNPVSDSLDNVIETDKINKELPVITSISKFESENNLRQDDDLEKGFLDFVADIEESINDLSTAILSFGQKTQEINDITAHSTEEINLALKNPSSGTMSHVRKMSRKLASNYNDYVTFVSQNHKEYRRLWDIFEKSLASLIDSPLIGQSDESIEEFKQFLCVLETMKGSILGAISGMAGMQESTKHIMGLESSLTRVASFIEREIKIYISILDKSVATLERAIVLGNVQVDRLCKT